MSSQTKKFSKGNREVPAAKAQRFYNPDDESAPKTVRYISTDRQKMEAPHGLEKILSRRERHSSRDSCAKSPVEI